MEDHLAPVLPANELLRTVYRWPRHFPGLDYPFSEPETSYQLIHPCRAERMLVQWGGAADLSFNSLSVDRKGMS